MRKMTRKLRIVNLGRVSTRTHASFVGVFDEPGNYPMLWRP